MRIVLSGIETNNKGAELMLYAILQEVERKHPNAAVYVPLYAVRQGLGYVKTGADLREKPFANFKRNWVKPLHLRGIFRALHLPDRVLSDHWPVSKADYFLDASGFIISDQWKPDNAKVRNFEFTLSAYKKQGTKIVYLPQAFGPVELETTQELVRILNRNADLIMPREKPSFAYLKNAGVDEAKMRIFTDFTSLVEGESPERYKHLSGGICVIPNARMIDKGALSYVQYTEVLKSIIGGVRTAGRPVYILSHEIESDNAFCEKLGATLEGKVEVVTGLNALEVKGLISTAYLCVSSRFHGVASALNSCVPCLATSWSHKYAELFADYKQEGCVLDFGNPEASLAKIAEFLEPERNKLVRAALAAELPRIKAQTREMWNAVWGLRQ